MKRLIGVIGGRTCPPELEKMAEEVGQLIAHKGWGLVCGGMGGIMEAAARGCQSAGGLTVGILPGDDFNSGNPFLDVVIPTGLGIARNLLVVRAAAGLIAIDGQYGTLSEIAFALQLGKPLIGLKTWEISEKILPAQTASEAIELLEKALK